MKRKTYNNVVKAGKLIQKKGYGEKESLEMAVKIFDELERLNNGMSIEWLIDKLKKKTRWESFFNDTEDIQCISCLDAYVLKYAIGGCWVQIDRHSSDKDSKFTLSIRGYDEENKKDLYESDFSKEWKEKNVYNQVLVKKFVSGYFFYE